MPYKIIDPQTREVVNIIIAADAATAQALYPGMVVELTLVAP